MSHGRFDNPVTATMTGILDLFRKQKLSERLTDQDSINGKTCIVTGANSGLGFAISVELAKRGGNVIMACRSQIPEAGEKVKKASGSEHVRMLRLDLSDLASVHAFRATLEKEKVRCDLMILNAGVATPKARKTGSGLDEIFQVNYLANFILLHLMLQNGTLPGRTCNGKRRPGDPVPRVVFISSDSHQGSSSIDYDEFGKFFEYGIKKGMNNYSYYKLVLNTMAVEFSRRINKTETDVSMNVICPGPVNTNIIRNAPWLVRIILRGIFSITFQSPEKAAKAVIYMAISPDFEGKTGEYLHMFNPKKMDPKVYDAEEGKKLWEHSADVWKRVDPKAAMCKV
ncbi:MAG: SDR family NAD(P)-dependent oxidoreductase [Bacteroidales bacterium]|nr:SDR family NAD(P)-dependent oxidoreductase [Bacteroidales bacterium]MDT8432690.1 SDR family NAD(P)-dependent oxidoreductase [Bacteroidales bacterium]